MTLGQERTEEQLNVTPGDNGTVENINTTPADMAEDIATAAEATTEDQPAGTDAPEQKKVYKNKKEVIARLKEIAHEDDNPKKDEVDYLKTIFYKLHFAGRFGLKPEEFTLEEEAPRSA